MTPPMLKKPFVLGVILAIVIVVPLLVIIMVRRGRAVPPPLETAGHSDAGPREDIDTGATPEVDRPVGPAARPIGKEARALAAAIREAVLKGEDLEALLAGAGGDLAEAIRAYLDLVRQEEELQSHAKMIQALADLPDPSGDVLRFCQEGMVSEDRTVLKMIMAQILEARADESCIGAFHDVLEQYWYLENPLEGWGVMRASLRGLGKIGSKEAREELWEKFWKAPNEELAGEVLSSLTLRMDQDVIKGIRGVIKSSEVPEEVRIGAVGTLAAGMKADRKETDTVMISVYGDVDEDVVRAQVIKSAAETGGRVGLEFVADRMLDYTESDEVRLAAIFALHHYGDRDSLDFLQRVIVRERGTQLAILAKEAVEAIRQRVGE